MELSCMGEATTCESQHTNVLAYFFLNRLLSKLPLLEEVHLSLLSNSTCSIAVGRLSGSLGA